MKHELALQIHGMASALCGVVNAVVEGPNEPENYYDGLYYLSYELLAMSKKLCDETEKEAPISEQTTNQRT